MLGLKKKQKKDKDSASAANGADRAVKKSGKTALCLGGGGMRGFAHIGAMKAMDERGVNFDMACGTSIGSLMSALYAIGMPFDEMIAKAGEFRFKKLHNGIPFPSKDPERIRKTIADIVGNVHIEDLPKPYFCIAVDVSTGEQVILDRGPLDVAIACSCNIPILFKPYPYGDKKLCDGGLRNNMPAATARMFGADKVITVDVNPTRGSGTKNFGFISMILATIDICMSNSAIEGLINSDIIIAPDLSKFSAYDENGFKEMIDLGYAAATEQMDKIIRVVESRKLY